MKLFKKKKQPLSPIEARIRKIKKSARRYKIKFFLLITLPVTIITLGQAVLKEYIRIRVRQAAAGSHPKSRQPNPD